MHQMTKLNRLRPLLFAIPVVVLIVAFAFRDILNSPLAVSRSERTADEHSHLPEVLIYRRSKKTGSSSMLDVLLNITASHDYKPMIYRPDVMEALVRVEAHKRNPSRLIIAGHNRVTRDETGGRSTLIVDTVLDGYTQITSYCRYSSSASDCKESMVRCLESSSTRNMNYYRWAGRKEEDDATYIDIPLSSAHPSLSTTVFRHVFEDATLDVGFQNVMGTACPEDEALRRVYNKYYGRLDKQVRALRARMLALAGYPYTESDDVSLLDMLDAADELESSKYQLSVHKSKRSRGAMHANAVSDAKNVQWFRKNGKVVLAESRGANAA